MNASRHQFTEPYTPVHIAAEALAIDAQYHRESELREWARRIDRDGPRDALKVCLRDAEVTEWSRCARQFLTCDGDDDGDFAGMMEALDQEINPPGYGLPDYDPDAGHGWWPAAQKVSWGMGGGL